MIKLTKLASATTILSMATAAVLLVGCGGGSNNAKQPSPTAQPSSKQAQSSGSASGGAAGKSAQGAAPSQEACTVKVAGHCVVVDPNKVSSIGHSGAAPQSGQASGGSQSGAQPRATATPAAGRQNAQPSPRGQNGKPSAFSGQPSAKD